MRCPECQKFVSYDEPQAEINSVEVNDESVTADVTVQLNCSDCGTTLKQADLETEEEINHNCKPDAQCNPEFKEGEDQFEVEDEGDAEGTSRLEDKDRHGNQIKSFRFMKTFYGFSLDSEIKCLKCSEKFTITLTGEEQASSFEEVC